jgi:hypothetical protein
MLFLVVTNGKKYEWLPCAPGVNPDVAIAERYPADSGWIFVGGVNSEDEVTALIENDCSFCMADSY